MSAKRELERELLALRAQMHRQAIRQDVAALRQSAGSLTPIGGLLKGAKFLIGARRATSGSGASWALRALGVGLFLVRRFRKSRNTEEPRK